jgi:plasmid stability protein
MRTTVDIPDPLYRQLKVRAAGEGRSVRELILRSVSEELRGRRSAPRRRVKLPIIASKRPGSLELDNAAIYEIVPFP